MFLAAELVEVSARFLFDFFTISIALLVLYTFCTLNFALISLRRLLTLLSRCQLFCLSRCPLHLIYSMQVDFPSLSFRCPLRRIREFPGIVKLALI